MATRQAIYNLKVDTQGSDKSVKDLTNQFLSLDDAMEQTRKVGGGVEKSLKDLNNTVDNVGFAFEDTTRVIDAYKNLAAEAGTESAIGREAIQRAADLERKYQDIEQTIGHMAERGNAFQSAIGISETVLGGYTAFQGVTAMLGVENEELLETLTKMQAAQSVLMGIESIRANLQKNSATMTGLIAVRTKVATAATWAYSAAQKGLNTAIGTGTKASKIFRGALIATGIGAIVVGIGMLVANFDKLVGWVEDAAAWFGELADKFEWLGAIVDVITQSFDQLIAVLRFLGIMESEAEAAQRKRHEERIKQLEEETDKLAETRDEITAKYDHEIKMAKIAGENTINLEREKLQAVRDSIKEEIKLRLQLLTRRASIGEEVTEEEKKQIEELKNAYITANREIEVFEAETQKTISDERKKARDERKSAAEKEAEEERARLESEAQLKIELDQKLQDFMVQNLQDANVRKLAQLELDHQREREQLIQKYGKDTELMKQLEIQQNNELLAAREEIKAAQEERDAQEREKERAKEEAAREERLLKLENDLMFMEMEHQMKLEKEIELERARAAALLANDELTEEERRRIVKESENKINSMKQASAEFENQVRQQQVQGAIDATSQVLSAVIAGAEEGSAVAKAAGIAQATIDTYTAAQGAYSSLSGIPYVGPFLGAAAAAAAIAAGVVNIKKIASTKAPGGSSGGGGSMSAPSVPSTPNINDRPDNEGQLTNVGEDGETTTQEEEDTQVYVSEIDLKRTRNRAQDIELRSTI